MSARLVLLGPPGAGKGTQAARISERLGVPAISTGDIFRANVAEQTELGRRAQRYMDAGSTCPTRSPTPWWPAGSPPTTPLTGSCSTVTRAPRTRSARLDGMLESAGTGLTAVVEITADVEEAVARMLKRAAEQGRADDNEAVIRRRLEVYAEQTAPWPPPTPTGACWSGSTAWARSTPSPTGSWRPWPRACTDARPGAHRVQDPRPGPRDAAGRARRRRHPCRPPRGRRTGMTTADLDAVAADVLDRAGARSNFLGYQGYPAHVCISVNEEIVHGIPGAGCSAPATWSLSTAAPSWPAGTGTPPSPSSWTRPTRPTSLLVRTTERAMWAGVAALATGTRLGEVGAAVEDVVDDVAATTGTRLGIVEEYVGHGIGTAMHQPPDVLNYRARDRGPRLRPGMVLCVEPMITAGSPVNDVLADDWTVVTRDGSRAAHYEHTVALGPAGVWVLTAPDGGAAALGEARRAGRTAGLTGARPRGEPSPDRLTPGSPARLIHRSSSPGVHAPVAC